MRAGSTLGDRFELLEPVGAGGMAEIWTARDRADGSAVAVKLLGDSQDPESARRFEREAQVLSQLSHPRIVRHLAAGTTMEGGRWLAMEWLDGEDLETRLGRGPLALDEALELVGRASEALGHAHSRSIVHRDVKPANLLLRGGRFDDVHVLDFGIAYLGKRATTLTRTAMIIGTPGFMSPEQVRGEEVDSRTDVFALGAVLYECVVGQPAFLGPTPAAVLARVLFHDPPDLGEVVPGCPRSICRLCARMLAKDPSARPADGTAVANEIAAALEALVGGVEDGSGRSLVLGTGEMRLVSVVLAQEAAADADTLVDDRTVPSPSEPSREGMSGWFVRMLDGTTAAVFEGSAGVDARELAQRAARCALTLGEAAGTGTVAVATGRAQLGRRVPVGEVIDRAARMAGLPGPGVRLDEVTAGLVGDRFEIGGDEGGSSSRRSASATRPGRCSAVRRPSWGAGRSCSRSRRPWQAPSRRARPVPSSCSARPAWASRASGRSSSLASPRGASGCRSGPRAASSARGIPGGPAATGSGPRRSRSKPPISPERSSGRSGPSPVAQAESYAAPRASSWQRRSRGPAIETGPP
ncbi:MAG: protein kinase [Deltaproteobacteria bacterium]|nr:protein kinase [Deltaproteobacteria bacterium]